MKTLLIIFTFLIALTTNINAQWIQTSGPEGGWIRSITSNSQYMFAGTDGGVFRSSDNGQTWSNLYFYNSYGPITVNALITKNNYIFAGTDYGVYYSINNGNNWTLTSLIYEINCFCVLNNDLYAGTYGFGIYKSVNNGTNWYYSSNGLLSSEIAALYVNNNNIYAGTFGGSFYISTNSGNIWTKKDSGLNNSYINSIASYNTNIFVGTNDGLFKSTNDGDNWSKINTDENEFNSLTVNANNIFAGTLNGIYLSTNSGNNWTLTNNGIPFYSIDIRSLYSDGSNVFAGTFSAGIFKSSNIGLNWTSINSGLINTTANCFLEDGNKIFAGTFEGIFMTTNNGSNWNAINNGLNNLHTTSLVKNGNTIFAGTYSGLYLSTNNGANWNSVNSGLPDETINAIHIYETKIFVSSINTLGTDSIYLSTNNGVSWINRSAGLPQSGTIQSIASINNNIFICSYGGGIYSSTNEGVSWNNVTNNLSNNNIAEMESNGNSLYACLSASPYIYESTNYGESWTQKNGLIPYGSDFEFKDNKIYLSTDLNGVFLSTDNGDSWIDFSDGLRDKRINSLLVTETDVFAGVKNVGVWNYPTYSSIEIGSNEIPEQFALHQNYPNPFNPTTKISFSISQNSFVKLNVYDITGKKITELVDQELKAGNHEYEFNGSNLPSGIYYYQIEMNNGINTRKMMLVK